MSRNITDLHPTLQEKAKRLVSLCATAGLKIQITDCYRNAEEQADCVARGVSTMLYPKSHHNWGTAFDFCRNDGKGSYNEEGNFFNRVGEIGKSIGLIWGGSWSKPDKPHFQLGEWGVGTAKLLELYKTPAQFKATWAKTTSAGAVVPPNPVVVAKDAWVERLQRVVGVSIDGISGPKTLKACPVLKVTSKGDVVKLLQERLLAFGFSSGKPDGIFGEATKRAVVAFQTAKNISNDGIVGVGTWSKLLGL